MVVERGCRVRAVRSAWGSMGSFWTSKAPLRVRVAVFKCLVYETAVSCWTAGPLWTLTATSWTPFFWSTRGGSWELERCTRTWDLMAARNTEVSQVRPFGNMFHVYPSMLSCVCVACGGCKICCSIPQHTMLSPRSCLGICFVINFLRVTTGLSTPAIKLEPMGLATCGRS